jgi:PPOX class probable F420-dependent enzyme
MRNTFSSVERSFIESARVARLATVDAQGRPHVVPVCFALVDDRFYIALDEKPKRVRPMDLKRVRNIVERSEASLLVDRYSDDWSLLAYVLVHCTATLVPPSDPAHAAAMAALRTRYPPYGAMNIGAQPIIMLAPVYVSSWGAVTTSPHDLGDAARTQQTPERGLAFLSLASARRSVRTFSPRSVEHDKIEAMLEAARWAPSPHGRQPWRFVILTRSEPKVQLADAMGSAWQWNLEMDGQAPEVVAARLEKSRRRILEAPVIILVCLYTSDLDMYPDAQRQAAEVTMAIQSLGAAVQNMLLAACTQGLDTGWMCAPLFCPDSVSSVLGLGPQVIPHALITVGYAAQDPIRRPHQSISELILLFD